MLNEGVGVADYFKIISEGNTSILHLAFIIQHFEHQQGKRLFDIPSLGVYNDCIYTLGENYVKYHPNY